MQEDPKYKQMIKRSFILKKTPDLQIPLVKKQILFKHEIITTLAISTCIHLAVYPFDTIKNRMIAKNSKLDVAFFTKNNTAELTTYLGITRGYASLMIGNICHLLLGKQSLLLAAGVEGLLKTWVDISKISKQMGNEKGDIAIMKKSFFPCAFFGIIRDVIFRTSYVALSSYFHKFYLANSRFYDERKRVNNLFVSTILATLVSHPFDVCFVKTASQRIFNYTGILQTPRQIIRQDGVLKMFIGGLWARLAYNILSTMILANTYEPFSNAVLEAF